MNLPTTRTNLQAGMLPSDVLQHFFSITLDTLKNSPQSTKRVALVSLCLVSCPWNEAALNDARLWGRVVDPCDPSLERFRLDLGRSKKAPLEISSIVVCPPTRPHLDPFETPQWETVLSEIHRLKSLHLTLPVKLGNSLFFKRLMMSRATALEHLTIAFRGHILEPAVQITAPRGQLLFSGQANALRSLTLGNCIFPPRLIPFENLEFLRMKNTLLGLRLQDHIKPWWDLCCSGQMKNLESLYFENLSFASFHPQNRCAAVDEGTISSTMKIYLEGDVDACVWLLDRDGLEFPVLCNLELVLRKAENQPLELDLPREPERVLSLIVSRILEKDSSVYPCTKLTMDGSRFVHQSKIRRIAITYPDGIGFSTFLSSLLIGDPDSVGKKLNLTPMARFTGETRRIVQSYILPSSPRL